MEKAIRNYIEGWYDKDTARIQQAVHPLIVKQGVMPNEDDDIRSVDLATFLEVTPVYGGDPSGKRTIEMKILSTDGDIASATLTSNEYMDYLHLARIDGKWRILNVLWEFRSDDLRELTPEETLRIEEPLRDYVEGWYDKDADRVAKGLHPNLAKRSLNADKPGELDQYTRSSLLDVVGPYGGPGGPGRIFEMTVLGVKNKIASVRLVSNVFVDHVHLVRTGGQWKILNVLWKWK
jgi:hypothetical protein